MLSIYSLEFYNIFLGPSVLMYNGHYTHIAPPLLACRCCHSYDIPNLYDIKVLVMPTTLVVPRLSPPMSWSLTAVTAYMAYMGAFPLSCYFMDAVPTQTNLCCAAHSLLPIGDYHLQRQSGTQINLF